MSTPAHLDLTPTVPFANVGETTVIIQPVVSPPNVASLLLEHPIVASTLPAEPATELIPVKTRTGTFMVDVLRFFKLPGMFSIVTLIVLGTVLAIDNGSAQQCVWEYHDVSNLTGKPLHYIAVTPCQFADFVPLLGITLLMGVMFIGLATLGRYVRHRAKR